MQLATPVVLAGDSVHEEPEKLPAPIGETLRATSPVGVMRLPAPVSVTVAVQLETLPTCSDVGVQERAVAVGRGVIVQVKFAMPLFGVGSALSVTVIVTLLTCGVVGVPVISPLVGSMDRPVGSPVAA